MTLKFRAHNVTNDSLSLNQQQKLSQGHVNQTDSFDFAPKKDVQNVSVNFGKPTLKIFPKENLNKIFQNFSRFFIFLKL